MRPFLDRLVRGELPPPPVMQLLGIRLVEVDAGRAVVSMSTDPALHANPMGTVHGGILCDVADAAMGIAFASTLDEGESFTTLELKTSFVRPVWQTTLRAEATVIQRGRTVGLVECTVADGEGRMVARASSTCLTLRGDQARGR